MPFGSMPFARLPARLGAVRIGAISAIPAGYFQMLIEQRGPRASTRPERIQWSGYAWEAIARINQAVNAAITPVTDARLHGIADHWTDDDVRAGDCDDYVMTKRRRLAQAGYHLGALLPMIGFRGAERHAVLVIRTDAGDVVADNLRPDVLPWNRARLLIRPEKIVSPESPVTWRVAS